MDQRGADLRCADVLWAGVVTADVPGADVREHGCGFFVIKVSSRALGLGNKCSHTMVPRYFITRNGMQAHFLCVVNRVSVMKWPCRFATSFLCRYLHNVFSFLHRVVGLSAAQQSNQSPMSLTSDASSPRSYVSPRISTPQSNAGTHKPILGTPPAISQPKVGLFNTEGKPVLVFPLWPVVD